MEKSIADNNPMKAPEIVPLQPMGGDPISGGDMLDVKGLCKYMGISRSTLWRRLKLDPTFPKGKAVTSDKRIWLRRDIWAWYAKA